MVLPADYRVPPGPHLHHQPEAASRSGHEMTVVAEAPLSPKSATKTLHAPECCDATIVPTTSFGLSANPWCEQPACSILTVVTLGPLLRAMARGVAGHQGRHQGPVPRYEDVAMQAVLTITLSAETV